MQPIANTGKQRLIQWGRMLMIAGMLGAGVRLRAESEEVPLSFLDARFRAEEKPVCMEYDVGYRFLHIELKRIGKIVVTTTIGKWQHRISGQEVPAIFLDMKANSPDSAKGKRSRVSIHDRIVAVMTLPELDVLVFAKHSDEYLNPLIGRTREILTTTIYNAEAGHLEYESRNLKSGVVSTNLVNPEELLKLSHRVKPLMNFLIRQYEPPADDTKEDPTERIVVNMDGRVVALRLVAHREMSPASMDHFKMPALHLSTATERGSDVKPRNFHSWCAPFDSLAEKLKDAELLKSARGAPVRSVLPLMLIYELGLGSVRATMTAIHLQ